MSKHTPQHQNDNDPAAEHVSEADLITGEPPVPITVWRTARTDDDAWRSIGARLAARLIAAYSRTGDAVVDLTTDHALTTACTAGGRRHHPAWFTDAASMIIGPVTRSPQPERDGDEADDDPEPDTWFGDDLTDSGPSPARTSDVDLPPGGSLRQATSLVVAGWPLDGHEAANRVRLAWLLTGCARLLHPGGCLILVIAAPDGAPTGPQDFTPVLQAAATVGLGYLQHIVAVTADTDSDAFIYHATDEELLALAGTAGRPWGLTHLRVHADLLVFSHTSRAGRTGGRHG